jgi:hypothetical protein
VTDWFKFADAPNRRGQHVRFAFASTLAPPHRGAFSLACVCSFKSLVHGFVCLTNPGAAVEADSSPALAGLFLLPINNRGNDRRTPVRHLGTELPLGRVFARDQGLFLLVWWLSPGPRLYKAGCVQPKPPELSRRQASHRRHGTASSSR